MLKAGKQDNRGCFFVPLAVHRVPCGLLITQSIVASRFFMPRGFHEKKAGAGQ